MTPEQEIKLNEVHAAIVGNKKLGHKGLAERVQELEVYKETDKKFKNKVAGAMFIGTPILVALWEWAQRRIMGA